MNNIPVSTTQQTNTNPIINTQTPPQNPTAIASDTVMLQLQEGQLISGEVIDHIRNEVTILLEDNQTITAPLSDNSLVTIGETFTFQVLKAHNNQPLLQALHTNTSPLSKTILDALEAANLPKSERNQEIVQELLNHQMSIDKQTIQNVLRHSIHFKEASISSLVLMAKNHLPITEENVTQFENYRNYEHRLVKEIEQIVDSLPEVITDVQSKADANESILLLNKMLLSAPSKNSPYFSLSQQDTNELSLFLDNHPTEKELFSKILERKESPHELLVHLKEQGIEHPIISNITQQYHAYQMEQPKIGSFPHSSIPLTSQDGTISTHDLLVYLEQQLSPSDTAHNFQFFANKQYKAILKEHLLHEWTLTPKDLTQKDAVSNLYNKMYQVLSDINKFISQLKFYQQTGQENEPLEQLQQNTTNIRQNIDFMKTLNQLFTYVQLPLQLKDKTVHSDLYVYTNKKDLKKSKDQVSALLHLDLDYLGSLDIHINLNYKQITSKFYLESNELQEFLSEHIGELSSILENKGYIFHGEVHYKENESRESNVINNFLEASSSTSMIQKYSFDIRT